MSIIQLWKCDFCGKIQKVNSDELWHELRCDKNHLYHMCSSCEKNAGECPICRDNISEQPSSDVVDPLVNLSPKKKDVVLVVFDFWNLYKGEKRWKSHRKITPEVVKAVLENYPEYSIEDICSAIDNYAKVLLKDEYFWEYPWPLYTFLTVKHEKHKDAPKKWWQFLPENFIEENYLIKNGRCVEKIEDPDPELTEKLIREYSKMIGNKRFSPSPSQHLKFVKTTIKLLDFFKKKSIIKENWIVYLFGCLEENYINRGEALCPGHLCSDHTWEVLMPQYIMELGIEE